MYDLDRALEGLFYTAIVGIVSAVLLATYMIYQSFFGFTEWEICSKMETDTAKVQCMEAHYE